MPAMSRPRRRHVPSSPIEAEYFVPIDWLDTVPLANAVDEVGLFGNQNTVYAPKRRSGGMPWSD